MLGEVYPFDGEYVCVIERGSRGVAVLYSDIAQSIEVVRSAMLGSDASAAVIYRVERAASKATITMVVAATPDGFRLSVAPHDALDPRHKRAIGQVLNDARGYMPVDMRDSFTLHVKGRPKDFADFEAYSLADAIQAAKAPSRLRYKDVNVLCWGELLGYVSPDGSYMEIKRYTGACP